MSTGKTLRRHACAPQRQAVQCTEAVTDELPAFLVCSLSWYLFIGGLAPQNHGGASSNMVPTDSEILKLNAARSHVSIFTGSHNVPIEVTVTGKLPPGAGSFLVAHSLRAQAKHPEFLDEYNEPSATIGKTDFTKSDPTAVYTFGVDTRDLTFHRHAGHRAITGITGGSGCILKFSLCGPVEALRTPEKFVESLYFVRIPGDRLFVLRFSGTVYHQFCPADPRENGFFAVSVHTNEAAGLSGDLLTEVLANRGNIPLLTEPAPPGALRLLEDPSVLERVSNITLDIE